MRHRYLVLGVVALAAIGCPEIDDPHAPDRSTFDITSLTAADTAFADGASLVQISATVPPNAPASRRTVAFFTNLGTFTPGATASSSTALANSTGQAVVELQAPREPGTAFVQASNGGAVQARNIRFVRALPDRIDLDADSFAAKADPAQTITIRALLRRLVGFTSARDTVAFTAVDTLGKSMGFLGAATPSDDTGLVTVRYSPGKTDYRGLVVVTGTTAKSGGGTVYGRLTISVTNP